MLSEGARVSSGPPPEHIFGALHLTQDWRIDHNSNRPHGAHGWLTPVEFVEAWLNRQQLQLA